MDKARKFKDWQLNGFATSTADAHKSPAEAGLSLCYEWRQMLIGHRLVDIGMLGTFRE